MSCKNSNLIWLPNVFGCMFSWLGAWIPTNWQELSPSLRRSPKEGAEHGKAVPANIHRLVTITVLMLCSSKAGSLWVSACKTSLAHKLRYSRRGFCRLYSRDLICCFLEVPCDNHQTTATAENTFCQGCQEWENITGDEKGKTVIINTYITICIQKGIFNKNCTENFNFPVFSFLTVECKRRQKKWHCRWAQIHSPLSSG